jgi:hypothetical protein
MDGQFRVKGFLGRFSTAYLYENKVHHAVNELIAGRTGSVGYKGPARGEKPAQKETPK